MMNFWRLLIIQLSRSVSVKEVFGVNPKNSATTGLLTNSNFSTSGLLFPASPLLPAPYGEIVIGDSSIGYSRYAGVS